jgi:glycosyltransferase involved in cell wall biosynthesis
MGNPLVSVVIPTYNRAGIISRTIDDIFRQTYRNFELIVVDDGSTDETQSVLKRYGDRIRVLTQDNAGPAVARNRGARAGHGEIIAFQDSDDSWHPTKLARQVALLEMDKSIPCCLCNVLMRLVDGKPFTSFDHSLVRPEHAEGIWLNVLDVLTTRFVLFNQAAAIRRWAFEKARGFPEDLKYLEDYDLPLRLSLQGPWTFIREPLVTYGESSPTSFSERAKKESAILRECEATIYERILATSEGIGLNRNARRNLRRRLRSVQVRIRAAQLMQARSPVSRFFGKSLIKRDRYLLAAYRRSPWFPQALTTPVEALRAAQAPAA